jgi:serine/threonine protein kinase/tetratricopeptide (TPR) repeat protein
MDALLTNCPRDLLVRCLQDELSAPEEATLEAHLSTCAACRTALEQLAGDEHDWTIAASVKPWSAPITSGPILLTTEESTTADFAVDFLSPSDDPTALGRLDDIEILGVVGRGAMGIVLKGRQPELQRIVAVKVLRPELSSSGAARQRFAREAQAAAAIQHPNVMPIHAVHSQGRLPYLVMPYIACESLQQKLDRQGPLELVEVLRIGIQVAQALAASHAQGLIHRDVKPANILMEKDGRRALLADFGLARAVDDASLTRSGVIAGTPQYMSPEQARGAAVDFRTDLFSLGSVLYALCAGRPAFRATSTYGLLQRIGTGQARPLDEVQPSVPPWMVRLVAWLMARLPARRPASAALVAETLEHCLCYLQQPQIYALPEVLGEPVPVSPLFEDEGLPAEVREDDEPSVWPLIGMGAAVVMSLVVVIGGMGGAHLWFWPSQEDQPSGKSTVAHAAFDMPGTERNEFEPPTSTVPKEPTPQAPVTPSPVAQTKPVTEPTESKPQPTVTPIPVIAKVIGMSDDPAATPTVTPPTEDKPPATDSKYGSADEAWRIGITYLSQREYAKSRKPLEAALAMSEAVEDKVRISRALTPVYTQIDDWTKKAGVLEYIIRHSTRTAERSLARTELMGFLRERGKTNDAVKRYEAQLKETPNDIATIYILIEVYGRLKDEPRRSAELLDRWNILLKEQGEELSVRDAAQLAGESVKAKQFKRGAELFEAVAARDASLAAWHYKEAAAAWIKAGDKEKAVQAAKASSASSAEKRSELLTHFWHRGVADAFFEAGEYALAIPHYDQAIATTTIEGYRKDCLARREQAAKLAPPATP